MTAFTTSPLNYPQGADTPIRRLAANRAPTTTDTKNVIPGDEWLDRSSLDWWKLVEVSQGAALWVKIGANTGNPETLEGNSGGPVGPNASSNIFTIGDTAQGISIDGDPITFTLTTTVADATTLQKGVMTLATNAETIAGTVTDKAVTPDDLKAKLGTQTSHGIPYGAGTTLAVAWLAEASDGQIPIGSTGNAPVLANITSTGGTIIVSNGAGTINLESDSTAGNVRYSARKSANTTAATGDGTVFDVICDTVIANVGSGYNGTTGVFTAPVAGLYLHACIIATDLTVSVPTVGLVNFAGHAFDSNPLNMSASSSTGLSLVYTQILLMNQSDTVSLSVAYAGSTKDVTVQGGAGSSGCFMSGFLIG